MTEIRVQTVPRERIALPEAVSTAPTHNFCSLDLLKEDWSNKQSGKRAGMEKSTESRQGSDGYRQASDGVLQKPGSFGKEVGTGLEYWPGSGTNVGEDRGWGANNPPGIEGWSKGTQLGMFHASQALGLDPFDSTSNRLVNEWTAKRSVEIGRELREHYKLPGTATKADVVNAAVAFDKAGRFCAASQGVADKDQAYDGMVRDLVTSDLVHRYRTRFAKVK